MEDLAQKITVKAEVEVPVSKAWTVWNDPEHIKQWCFASDDWHAPYSENNLEVGGTLKTTMAAKDGSFSFEFEGIYEVVEENRRIEYVLGDGRRVQVLFNDKGNKTEVVETFDAESQNSLEMQRDGWQAILNNFKKQAERS
jgi:uncharacterized protein YndB with AHSA1/START domain